jgi:hypothetical protein
MKHLKKFNEELQPSTYISAGKGLKSKGHETRGQKLIDYGKSKTVLSDEYTFNVDGEKLVAKWDPMENMFITDKGGKIFLLGVDLKYNSMEKDPLEKGTPPTEMLLYLHSDQAHKIFSKQPLKSAYVDTREEAVELLKFLKSVKKFRTGSKHVRAEIVPSVNDLYREVTQAERDEQQKAKRFEDTFPKTKGPGGAHPKKDGFFKRIIKKFGDHDDSFNALGGKMD